MSEYNWEGKKSKKKKKKGGFVMPIFSPVSYSKLRTAFSVFRGAFLPHWRVSASLYGSCCPPARCRDPCSLHPMVSCSPGMDTTCLSLLKGETQPVGTHLQTSMPDNQNFISRFLYFLFLNRRSPARLKCWLSLGSKTNQSTCMQATPEVQTCCVSATPEIQS